MAAGSLLVDAGYVDEGGLRRAIALAEGAGRVPSGLGDVRALEFGLRSLAS